MILLKPSYEILDYTKPGYQTIIDHAFATIKIICDQGISHEIARHRHRFAGYTQESTIYCNYKDGLIFIIPPWTTYQPGRYTAENAYFSVHYPEDVWATAVLKAESNYINLLNLGWSPQQAHSILPDSLKTEIIITANVREWRHIIKLSYSETAHPQMREIMTQVHQGMKKLIPIIFDDIEY